MPDNITEEERIKLGKKGKLWRVELLGKVGAEVKRFEITNKTSDEVMLIRESIYSHGLAMPIDPGHWVVMHPADILEVHLWRQKTYFD